MEQIDSLFLMACTFFVMLMQVGFLLLESGIVRNKNSINVAAKNLVDLTTVMLLYWIVGFGLMFGVTEQGWFGTNLFLIDSFNTPPFASFFLFQAMFCATTATIISGAIAERGSLSGYVVITSLVAALIYPVFGHWVWSGSSGLANSYGWLAEYGFYDFAGSTVVHSIGGWMALAATIIVGPRIGRYTKAGYAFKPYNLVLTVAGVIFLWVGWMGFNAGSNLSFDQKLIGIVLNTAIAASAGGVICLLLSNLILKTFDVVWVCNGMLAGLVSVTASCSIIDLKQAVIIGGQGALICVLLMGLLDKLKIDDVVHAIPVHLGAGIWGTIAVALFGDMSAFAEGVTRLEQLKIQLVGIGAAFVWAFGLSYILLYLFNKIIPLRVSAESEIQGLNLAEHSASNEVHDLIHEMQLQEMGSNFRNHVKVEPATEVGQIARQYNRILDRFNQATRAVYQQNDELKAKQEKLEKMQGQLINQEKMAGLGQLAAGVAHEINNPISFVLQNIRTLDDYNKFFQKLISEYKAFVVAKSANDGTADEILERIDDICREEDLDYVLTDTMELLESTETGVKRVADIVRNMKTFSHPGSEKFSACSLHECVNSALDLAKNEIKQNIEVIENYEAEPDLVNANKSQLIQVFLNLIVNAAQAIGDSSQGIIKIISKNAGGKLQLEFIDSGSGIPEDKIDKVFDPFFTTKDVGKGTGLGLSISYGIIKKHKGKFAVNSQAGKGTKFTIELPKYNG